MEFICDSGEHHFLTMLHKLQYKPKNWMILHFSLSKTIDHSQIIKKPKEIHEKIKKHQNFSQKITENLMKDVKNLEKGYLYIFSDYDVVLLAHAKDEKNRKIIHDVYKHMNEDLRKYCSNVALLSKELYAYQKLADQKLLSVKRMEAYKAIGTTNKTGSIHVRRQKRDNGIIMVVEDDRFTASYTANILSSEYDVIICKNGEDALI